MRSFDVIKTHRQTGTPTRARASGTLVKPAERPRTPAQLERQERAFMLSVTQGKSVREIGAELGIDKDTVASDLRREQDRRAEELGERRENERIRAVAFYESIIGRAIAQSDRLDALLAAGKGGFSDRSLDVAIAARTRIDKILGIEAPTRIDPGFDVLLAALEEGRPD